MFLSNYHTHCHYCDGQENLEDYILYAIDHGFKALGFSSHAPVEGVWWTMSEPNLHAYLKEVTDLKKKYQGKIEIYKGLEIDYVPGGTNPSSEGFKNLGLDYSIGSFHIFPFEGKMLTVDGLEEEFEYLLQHKFRGSMAAYSQGYYDQVQAMMEKGGFDVLGHLDLIKKKNKGNRYFSEDAPWYKNQIRKILQRVKEWGGIMEINTGGISRGATDEIYPSPWIVYDAVKLGIPLCINSDAHRPEHLDFYFEESRRILIDAGAKNHLAFFDGKWSSFPL